MDGHLAIIGNNGRIIFCVKFQGCKQIHNNRKTIYPENFSKYGIHNILVDDILILVDPGIVMCTLDKNEITYAIELLRTVALQ